MLQANAKTIIFFLFLSAVIATLALFSNVSLELIEIRSWIESFGKWGPLVFILMYTILTIFMPTTPFMAVAGIFFGFFYGFIYCMIGGIASATITFFISRQLGFSFVSKILEHEKMVHFSKYNDKISDGGVWHMIFLRIMPIMPFNILNLIMGVSRISFKNYITGTILGLIPSKAATVYFGVALFNIKRENIITSILVMVAIVVVPIFMKYKATHNQN